MVKYCVNCGKQVEEGQPCDCLNKKSSIDFFKSTYRLCLDFFKKPVTITESIAQQADYKVGLIFICLQAVTAAAFSLVFIKQMVKGLLNILGPVGGIINLILEGIGVHYWSIFIKALLIVLLQFLFFGCVVYGLARFLFKKEISFKKVIAATGISSLPLTAVFLASTLFILILPGLVTYVLLFGLIAVIILNYFGIKQTMEITDNSYLYLYSSAYIVDCFLTIVVSKVIF
ncbi:MAG: YIP1 family protein [Ignavibacteriales bacterium]